MPMSLLEICTQSIAHLLYESHVDPLTLTCLPHELRERLQHADKCIGCQRILQYPYPILALNMEFDWSPQPHITYQYQTYGHCLQTRKNDDAFQSWRASIVDQLDRFDCHIQLGYCRPSCINLASCKRLISTMSEWHWNARKTMWPVTDTITLRQSPENATVPNVCLYTNGFVAISAEYLLFQLETIFETCQDHLQDAQVFVCGIPSNIAPRSPYASTWITTYACTHSHPSE